MIQKKHLNRAWHRQPNVSAARQTIIRADAADAAADVAAADDADAADAEPWFLRSLKRERTSNSNALPPTTFFIKKTCEETFLRRFFRFIYLLIQFNRCIAIFAKISRSERNRGVLQIRFDICDTVRVFAAMCSFFSVQDRII